MARAVPEPSGTRCRYAINHRCKVWAMGLARSCRICRRSSAGSSTASRPRLALAHDLRLQRLRIRPALRRRRKFCLRHGVHLKGVDTLLPHSIKDGAGVQLIKTAPYADFAAVSPLSRRPPPGQHNSLFQPENCSRSGSCVRIGLDKAQTLRSEISARSLSR